MTREPKVNVACDNCGAMLERYACHVKRTKRRFCDKVCQRAAANYRPCDHCGKPIQAGPTRWKGKKHAFCNHECYGAWGRANIPKTAEIVTVVCAQCGQERERYACTVGRYARYFCDEKCRRKWQAKSISGERNVLWKGGRKAGYYGPNWGKQKRAARQRDTHSCQRCGVTQEELGMKLDVHHIIPFREFGYIPGKNDAYKDANALDNLVSLCKRCHKVVEWETEKRATNENK